MKEQPKDKFPITLKKGHASVKIYRVKNRGAVNYCVSYVSPTGRQGKNFANLDLAKREASNVAQHLAHGEVSPSKRGCGHERDVSQRHSRVAR